MNWKTKTAIAGGIIIVFAVLIFIIKQQMDIIAQQKYAEQSIVEMKELNGQIMRAQAAYATREDLEKFIKSTGVDLKPIEDDLDKLGAEVKGVVTIVSKTPGYVGNNLPSDSTTPGPVSEPIKVECPDGNTVDCPNPDSHGYLQARQVFTLNEPFSDSTSVPFGYVGFSAWKEKPWDVNIYDRKYSTITVLSMNEEGRHFAHSQLMIDTDGKKYKLPITESRLVEALPEKRFRFSPRLYLGMDAGVKANPPAHFEAQPNLQLAFFSYGQMVSSPEWTFLGVGIGYEVVEEGITLILSPVNYNVGKHLPLVDNVYIGPSVSIDPDSNLSLMLGLRVGL